MPWSTPSTAFPPHVSAFTVFPVGIFEVIELPPQQVALFVLARRAQQKLSPQQSEDSVADAGSNDKSTDVARASPKYLAGIR